MGASEIAAFLTWLATARPVSASTQNQALSALLFLYRHVLRLEIGHIESVPRARMPVRVPVVLSHDEVARIMKHLDGVAWIIVALLYGAGLRLQACLELRVKDIAPGVSAGREIRRTPHPSRASQRSGPRD
jgi:integrase